MSANDISLIQILAGRERFRDCYSQYRDPIAEDRMLWRAQMFRHMVHLLPGQSILELGCGNGHFTRALHRISRGENPITAVTFAAGDSKPEQIHSSIEYLSLVKFSDRIGQRRF